MGVGREREKEGDRKRERKRELYSENDVARGSEKKAAAWQQKAKNKQINTKCQRTKYNMRESV